MAVFIRRFKRLFQSAQPVPTQLQPIFLHLFLDVAWYGILSGTTIAFMVVFATRQGATTTQVGLFNALPGLVNLLFALPAARWLSRHSIGRAVFWSSVFQRVFYLFMIPLPVLLMPGAQVWALLLMTLIMTIPGTALVVGFNAQFGEIVPVEWRGYVVGIRNAILSIGTTIFTLISGEILVRIPFPTGYQVVFALGVVGAALSSLHLYLLSNFLAKKTPAGTARATPLAKPEVVTPEATGEDGPEQEKGPQQGQANGGRRFAAEIQAIYQRGLDSLRLDAMKGPFARLMGLLFGWHLFQFMTIPIITPFVVNQLHLTDQLIGLAGGLFNATVFIGSLRLGQLTVRFGNKRLTGGGIMGLCLFPILTSFGATGYIVGNFVGGFAWAMAGGALYNYILENVPAHDRPSYLAWYNLVSNAAILIGSLLGPAIAGQIGFAVALVVFGVGRFLAGAAILRWG